ncbi:vasorin-like [Pocillopora damicornis]|uniref:vasorin-like n=1 Tax=Pocillopora damicornis TaxID=46731 RepID=UPI000F5591AC|nr:vasorin-like [Pocillopora damicornis]
MKKLELMKISDNLLSIVDAKVILKGLTQLQKLDLDGNPLGPSLPSDIFLGFENMTYLDLSSNKLTRIHKDTVEGLTDHLNNLYLQKNALETIGDGTLNQFKSLQRCFLADNKLTSVPDLTGPKTLGSLRLQGNRITDLSRIATSGIGQVFEL